MSFVFSKVLWAVTAPANALLILLVAGVAALWLGRRRIGTAMVATATTGFLVVTVLPVGPWMLHLLEQRFPQTVPLPERVDGIIVLGGAVSPILAEDHGQPALNGRAERLTELPALAARYPVARIIFTGGSGNLLEQRLREGPVAQAALERMGFDTARVTFESESRNTWENAILSRRIAQPAEGEVWLLVTSAAHMPRSVGIFRRLDWNVIAYPVDYQVTARELRRPGFDLARGLETVNAATREYVGLIAYHLMDRTDRLFPAP